MAVTISKGQGAFLIISFDYSHDKVEAIKQIEGHKWDPVKKQWTVPVTRKALEALAVAFCDDDIIFDSSIDLFEF